MDQEIGPWTAELPAAGRLREGGACWVACLASQPRRDRTVLRPDFCLDVKTDEATRAEVRVWLVRCTGVLT